MTAWKENNVIGAPRRARSWLVIWRLCGQLSGESQEIVPEAASYLELITEDSWKRENTKSGLDVLGSCCSGK